MAIWAHTDFSTGTIGQSVTTTTEPIFAATSSSAITYQAGIAGATKSAQILGTDTVNASISLAGKTHVRLGVDIERVLGAQTIYTLFILLTQGATNRGDVILRQTTGDKWALRGNDAAATTYPAGGNSARTHAIGETYHIEFEWTSGVGTKAYFWYPGNNTLTPDETMTSTMTLGADTIRIGNSNGASGTTIRFTNLRMSDGEQIRGASLPAAVIPNLRVGALSVTRIYVGATLASGAAASAAVVSDERVLPYWGAPTWEDNFDYLNGQGQLDLDPTKWQKWDYNTLSEGTMPGTLGLLNDASIVKGSQVAVVETPDGDTAVRIRSEWMDTPVITSSGPVSPQTYRHFKTGYIDQRNINNGNRQRYGRWETCLWIPGYVGIGLGMLWAFWFRNGLSAEWDWMEFWGSGPSAATEVTTGLYPRAAQPKPNAGTSTNTIHRQTANATLNRKVAFTHSYSSGVAGRWVKLVAIWTPDLFELHADGVVKTSLTPTSPGAVFPRNDDEIAAGTAAKTLWTAPEMNSPWYMRMNVHPGPSSEYYGVPDNNNRQWTADSDFMCKYVRVWAMPE